MRLLSLFSGMAGMDAGFSEQVVVRQESVPESYVDAPADTPGFVALKRLPFSTVFQNDILPCAKAIADWNGWSHNYVLRDIRELLTEDYAFPAADVIVGGFPCQDFSHAGKRAGLESARGTLYQSYVEVVRRVRPIVFVAENVNGLLTMTGSPINAIVADFAAVGYEVKYQLIKCEEHGIPQTRWRVIIMGLRLDAKTAEHGENWNVIPPSLQQCHVRPYFAHLLEPSVASDPAQQVYSKAAKLEKGQGQSQVPMDGFGPTMRAEHHGNIEFRGERRLTVREAALLQTFPPDCILTQPGKKATLTAYKPIGNAVPPLLGYIIAQRVLQLLPANPC